MANTSTILFPTDFSPVAEKAYQFALQLAAAIQARIRVVHISHIVPLESDLTPREISKAIVKDNMEEANRLLLAYAQRLAANEAVSVPIEACLLSGYAIEEIASLAESLEPELIVMGTTGASNAIENWLGSTTTALMERVECPIMAIPESAEFRAIQHIIYATDLHEGGERFLYKLSNTAHMLGASLERIHVMTEDLPELEQNKLEDQYGTLLAFGDMPLRVVEGKNVSEGLTTYAKEHEVDLIALSPQKHSLWHQIWHSSQTRRLLLHSSLPVLAVKP